MSIDNCIVEWSRLRCNAEGKFELDLHRLSVQDCLRHLDSFVPFCRMLNEINGMRSTHMIAIPGKGRHSPNGKSVLRARVITWCERNKYKCQIDSLNAGRVNIEI